MKDYNDKRQEIKDIIRSEIKNQKSDLAQVKSCIEEKFHKSLSTIDNAYIERRYIKDCARFWLQETTNIFKQLTERKSRTVIQGIYNSLDDIQNLSQIPNPLSQLEHYTLLIEHIKFINIQDEKVLIKQFKNECLEQTVAYSDSASKELVFLEAFVNLLSSSKGLQPIIAALKLQDFCRGDLPFDGLVNNIIKLKEDTCGENLPFFQEAADGLKEEKDIYLIDKFREVISAYIKPVEIQGRKIDGRLVVEVIGKNIVVSEILQQLENKLSANCDVEEVRFVGGDIIHIDANLKSEVWQGRNVVILTKSIKVHGKVTWNVSGKDNNNTYSSDAGIGEDGHGKQGNDGCSGESGGNVLILVEEIENLENFSIISNGGKGGKGQDGGNGGEGKDGVGITKAEFAEKFPPVAKFGYQYRLANILETFTNIEKDSQVITEWYEGKRYVYHLNKDVTFNENVIEKVKEDCKTSCFVNQFSNSSNSSKREEHTCLFDGNIFIHAMINQVHEFIFSFERGGVTTNCQAFLLYKGSSGQPGGRGGEWGLGGQGGRGGNITVKHRENSLEFNTIKGDVEEGKEGEIGKGGLYGNHGKNGWDMGYMDYSISDFYSGTWPQFFGEDLNSKLSLEFHDKDNRFHIQCPYRERKGERCKYAKFKTSRIDHKKQTNYEQRNNTRQNRERQHHAQAVRKKNISQSSILASYSHHLSSTEINTLHNLRSDLENTKQQAVQAIRGNQKQQKTKTRKLNDEIKINRIFPFSRDQNKSKRYDISTTTPKPSRETIEVKSLINDLHKNPLQLNNWFQLKNTELSLSQINVLFFNFATLKDNSTQVEGSRSDIENTKVQDIEKLLIDKYRLATLQKIAKQFLPYQEVAKHIDLTPENAPRCLTEAKQNENNVSHHVLGTLNQYLYERNEQQRNNISKFCEEELHNSYENREILKQSLEKFILEAGESKECVQKYYNEYKEFLKKQERSLNIVFEALKSELSQPDNDEVFDLWVKSCKDKSLVRKLEEKIQNNDFLNVLYNRFNSQLKREYDWNECSKDQAVLNEHVNYIREKGLLSESYRELLACVFDTNIRIYVEGQDNRLFLHDNHNPSGKKTLYVLYKANEFAQLDVDENYYKLVKERKNKGDFYAKILIEIEPFKQKQEFDDYLKNKAFLSYNSPSVDEQSLNEEEDVDKIIEYFPEGERQQLKWRLDKITSQYIGQQGILHNILKRFSSEGRHVSSQELYCLISTILTSSIEDRDEQNNFCWIVAAHFQRNWIDELILLRIENYFRKTLAEKSTWRKYLSKIENKDILLLFERKFEQHRSSIPISTQCIEETLHLLSNIPNETVPLGGLELSEWPYALKEKYWTCKLSQLVDWQQSDLPRASYYLLSIENTFGTDLVENLLEALERKKQKLSPDKITEFFSHFHNEEWNLSKEELNTLDSCNIGDWAQEMQQKFTANKGERKITQLVELIKVNANTSKTIKDNLSKNADSIKNIFEEKYVVAGKYIDNFTDEDIKGWAENFKSINSEGKQSMEGTLKEISVIDRAIFLTKRIKLRDTQKLTVLVLLTNNRSTLTQVSTGEGKSLIVVAASIIKALCGEKVDNVTSSSVLAKRDAECYRDIYNLFGINVSHNCSEDIEKRKEAYSGNQVVYGDLSNFQRDYLLDRFYGNNILGDRNFNSVIVDEVDSMLLDKGNHMLYLSHNLPGLDKLESVYIYIWQWINRPAVDDEELAYAFDTKAIKEAVISNLYGLIKKEDIGSIGSELDEQQKYTIWERLVKAEILNNEGKLLKEKIDDNTLGEILSPELNGYKDRLKYLIKECTEREQLIHVPNYLKTFVEQHLESWINSAITAFCMKAKQDYIVDVDRTDTSPDLNPNIVIIDRDTGTDQATSQWDEALHQFLQLKHGCKLSLQSLKAVFISNVSFFKLYSNLYGLTGTLGSQRERDLLKEIHGVDFVTIPTAKSKQFHEDNPVLCACKDEWIESIQTEAKKLTRERKRSVLIICETVNDVETLFKAFKENNEAHVHTYTRDYEEFDKGFEIVEGNKELGQGQIIIATNLAGRGTDIKITEGLRKAGGLHVCITYLPSNVRIEHQAFGRAARSGDEGSGQLIIMDSKGQGYCNSKVLDLKKERDNEELHRISDIKAYYETQITVEEDCFKAFKERYEQLMSDLDGSQVPNEAKEILLQSCLDKWTFWLDENSKNIKYVRDEQRKRPFNILLDTFLSQFKILDSGYREIWLPSDDVDAPPTCVIKHDSNSWLAWVKGSPVQMIKLGRYLSQNEDHINAHENAIQLFDEVTKQESYFSEAAHYYKAFALANKIDWEQRSFEKGNKQTLKEFKKELRKAAMLLDKHSKFAINAAGIIGKIKKKNSESIIQIDAYEEQQKNIANLYYMFSQSINDIFGHAITPQSFVNYNITEEVAEGMYNDLLDNGILKKPRVQKNISKERLKTISSHYVVLVETLQHFLSEYEGQEIIEKDFHKKIKKGVQLPSRNEFWKLLIEQKVLSKEVKYLTIDNEKLRKIDPSLSDFLTEKVDRQELMKQTLESNNEQILFNWELFTQQTNIANIFVKEDFVKIVGENKYEILKEKGVLSFNKKAHIDLNKIKCTTFPCYDSVALEDFSKVNITKNEAVTILAELVDKGVLEKDPKSSVYRFKIKFDKIAQVQLPSCPVYEKAVKGLLTSCFTYRVALQKIEKQLEKKNYPMRLQLMTKPHQSLAFELLEQKIIRLATVTTQNQDLKEKLRNIYSRTMTRDDFKLVLALDKRIPKECTEELFNCLMKKQWIVKCNPIQSIQEEGISKESITNAGQSLVQELYYINSPAQRQIPLNFAPGRSNKNAIPMSQSIDKTVEKVLHNRLQLANEDTIRNVVSSLKRLQSSLKTLEVPDGKLTNLYAFANTEEMRVFSLNGFDQLLQLGEKKWTRAMLVNTAIVTAMGISQIAIGTVIELYSAGVCTHVGAALINEGVNDLFFAAGALKSGYFSWEDYTCHKLQSLMFSAVTVGVGAYLSRGTKVSRFGRKIFAPGFEYDRKLAADFCGTQLVAAAGWTKVRNKVLERFVLKVGEGIAIGLTNAGIDTIVENHLQALCVAITSDILSNIEREVENHNISKSLKKAFETLGGKNAKEMVDDLTKSVLTEQNCVEKFLPIAYKIASSVTQGIANAAEKRSMVGNKLELPIHAISKILVWTERTIHIAKIPGITGSLLNILDQRIKDKLNNNKMRKNTERVLLNQKQETVKDYEIFKEKVIGRWKLLLRERAGQIIARHIVSPVLKDGANHLVRYVGKKVQQVYKSYKESVYFDSFEALKQEYEKKLESEKQCVKTACIDSNYTKKYHKDLRKLMVKTKDPSLFAAIVRENIPMDLTCVRACIQVVCKVLKQQGVDIPGLTIIVNGDGGVRQEFSSVSGGSERRVITIDLKDNHFEFCGSSTSENNGRCESINNCLYDALSGAILGLGETISPEKFRAKVADCIQQDQGIRNHIQQGWHQRPLSLGIYGGVRELSKVVNDFESSSYDNEIHLDEEDYIHRERDVVEHLKCRLSRYFRIGGYIQHVSKETGIPRNEVVKSGASTHQDKRSHRGRQIHAAHVIRLNQVNPKLVKLSKKFHNTLVNFLGHTQNVPKRANEWHGIGGCCDKFHSSNLTKLNKIKFGESLTFEDRNTIKNIRDCYLLIIDKNLHKTNLSNQLKSELTMLRNDVTNTSIESLFQSGQDGYSGKGMDMYQ